MITRHRQAELKTGQQIVQNKEKEPKQPAVKKNRKRVTSIIAGPIKQIQSKIILRNHELIQRTFTLFSQAHTVFKLKFDTLFLAYSIYCKCLQAPLSSKLPQSHQQLIPQKYLPIVCLYLSIKYSEIYPPRLKHLLPFMKLQCQLRQYCNWEKMILQQLHCNLKMESPKTIIDQLLKQHPLETHYHAYYLAEVAIVQGTLLDNFSWKQICVAIVYIIRPMKQMMHKIEKFHEVEMEKITICSKAIVFGAINNFSQNSFVFRKYQHDRYLKVSQNPFVVAGPSK